MGVHEVGIRKAIMRNLEVYRAEEVAAAKKLEMEVRILVISGIFSSPEPKAHR